jgi:hypothetical protein
MNSNEIDMGAVAQQTARQLGAQIGELTAELLVQRMLNRQLHEEIERLREDRDGVDVQGDGAPESV